MQKEMLKIGKNETKDMYILLVFIPRWYQNARGPPTIWISQTS